MKIEILSVYLHVDAVTVCGRSIFRWAREPGG